MDSQITFDPRFGMMAKILGVSRKEVYGACFQLWLHCYQSRSECLSVDEANASAEIDGFAEAMIKVGLADTACDQGADRLTVHGVRERIRFLGNQSTRGKKGGKASAKAKQAKRLAEEKTGQANAKANARAPLADSASTGQAYSPPPSLPPAPAPALSPSLTQKKTTLPPELSGDEFEEAWKDFEQHRREIKKPLTPTATKQSLNKLAIMGCERAIEAIRHSIANGWQGIFEPDGNKSKPTLRDQTIANGQEFIRLTSGGQS